MVVVIQASVERQGNEPSEAKLPGSKSHSQRALLLAGLSPGSCLLSDVLIAEDTEVLIRALGQLGAKMTDSASGLRVDGAAANQDAVTLNLGENGTALRTLGAILPILGQKVTLDGLPGLRARPLSPLLSFLERAGVPYEGEQLPLVIDGQGMGWEEPVEVDAALSTQVASGVLLGLALRRARGEEVVGEVLVRQPSARGYLEVTAECLRAFGHEIAIHENGDDMRFVFAERTPNPEAWTVPADASTAAFPMVLRAMGGWKPKRPSVNGVHPDHGIVADIDRMMSADEGSMLLLDQVGRRPDCFPALCALAATREGTTTICGAPSLRGKESDRIAAMAAGLSALGLDVVERPDGLTVHGPVKFSADGDPVLVPAPADHRVVMALALLGSQSERGIELEHDRAVAKSWPGFWDWLAENAAVTRS